MNTSDNVSHVGGGARANRGSGDRSEKSCCRVSEGVGSGGSGHGGNSSRGGGSSGGGSIEITGMDGVNRICIKYKFI